MQICRLRMHVCMCVNILTPSNKPVNKSQKSIKTDLWFITLLEYIENPYNGQLADFRGDLKRLMSLTSIPHIALNTVNFYSASTLVFYILKAPIILLHFSGQIKVFKFRI